MTQAAIIENPARRLFVSYLEEHDQEAGGSPVKIRKLTLQVEFWKQLGKWIDLEHLVQAVFYSYRQGTLWHSDTDYLNLGYEHGDEVDKFETLICHLAHRMRDNHICVSLKDWKDRWVTIRFSDWKVHVKPQEKPDEVRRY